MRARDIARDRKAKPRSFTLAASLDGSAIKRLKDSLSILFSHARARVGEEDSELVAFSHRQNSKRSPFGRMGQAVQDEVFEHPPERPGMAPDGPLAIVDGELDGAIWMKGLW